jgi:RimJ/RimL family protein N-acetyltransferase
VIGLRPARPEDCDQVFVWRNDPVTRAMSRTSGPLQPEAHARWWGEALANAELILLIGEEGGGPVGVIAFGSREPGSWEASMHLGPEHRGRGLAAPLLDAAIAYAFPDGPPRLLAQIKPENAGSRRVFERCGFREQGVLDEVLLYERPA